MINYPLIRKQIIDDYQASHPNTKIRIKNPRITIKPGTSWKGITEYKSNGNCDITIPPGDGPTATKVLIHELMHASHGRIEPIPLGEFYADRAALKMLPKYGVPITDNILKRVYKYLVDTLRKYMDKGGRVPEKLKGLVRDVEIWNTMGEKFWVKEVRDKNLKHILTVLEV